LKAKFRAGLHGSVLTCISALAFSFGLFPITPADVILASATKQFAPAGSIGVSAKEIGSARNIVTRWQTIWGSFDRDYLATRDVEIEIHNLSQLPARIAIDFYFVGRPQRLPTPHKLFSKHTFIVNVAGSGQERFSLRSDVLHSRETYYATLGENYTSGFEIEGWILFVRLPGQPQPFDKVSSNKAMLEHLDWLPVALRNFENATNTRPNYASEIEPEPAPAPASSPNEMEPSTPLIVVEPTPEAIETAPSVNISETSAPTRASPPPAVFITVTKPTEITIGRRDEIILPGTKVQLVARAADTVQVRYKGESTFVEISSTDLK
jgi:hypothetical protein